MLGRPVRMYTDLQWLFDVTTLPQVHAPCGEDQVGRSVQDRILLLLGCTAPRCGTAAGSWRAFRLQSESQQAPSDDAAVHGVARSVQPQQHATVPSAAQPPGGDVSNVASGAASSSGGFGIGATSFGFDSPGNSAEHGASSDPMSFADLDLALTTISSAGSTPVAAKAPRQPSAGSIPAAAAADQHAGIPKAAAGAVRLQRGTSLPGFYISWQDEPDAAPNELRPADAAHVAGLVDQYEADHEMVRCVMIEAADIACGLRRALTSGLCCCITPYAGPIRQHSLPVDRRISIYILAQVDSAGEGWAGEAYEADTLPGGDSSFPKFSKRLQRAPEQCLRYRSAPQPPVRRPDLRRRRTPRPTSSGEQVLCF